MASGTSGFLPGTITNGAIHEGDPVASQANLDLITAYNEVAGKAVTTVLTGQDLGGLTLPPGVYLFSSSAQLTGTLILDAQGDPNAEFDFQIGSTLITSVGARVIMINGGDACEVYWQVGSSATLGTNTQFSGHILADISITVNSGASVDGSVLAINGSVTLDSNAVSITDCLPILTNPGNIFITENDPATAINPGINVTDVGTDTLSSATVTLTNYVADQDVLGFVNDGLTMGNISVVTNLAGVISLTSNSSSATTAHWQAALRAVTYTNTSDNPSTATRNFVVTTIDGPDVTTTLSSTINVMAVNDKPTVLGFDAAITYTEGNAALLLDADVNVTDVDSSNFDTGTLTVYLNAALEMADRLEIRHQGNAAGEIGVSGVNVSFEGTVLGTFTGGADAAPLVITFNASATPVAVQALVRNLTYRNVSENPSTAQRVVRIALNDGDGATRIVHKLVNVVAVNDAPVIGAFDTAITYTEGNAALLLDADVNVTDVDSANFDTGSLTVYLNAALEATDRLEVRHQGTGSGQIGVSGANVSFEGTVLGTFTGGADAAPLVITFNASATPVAVQALVRNLTYRNVSENPSTAQRVVRIALNDGDGATRTVHKLVNVVALNDAPVIGAFDAAVGYTENAVGIPLDADATVSDFDSDNFNTGTLTVTLTANAEGTDLLEVRHEGGGSAQISVTGSNVSYGGVLIGTFTGGTGATPLTITLNASATPIAVQALLRNVTFRSTSENPSVAPRTVRVALTDGDGGTSNLPTKTINVTAVNDQTAILGFDTALTYVEGTPALLLDTDVTVTDADSANFDTGSLTVYLNAAAETADRLEIRNEGIAAGQIGTSGANVMFGGVVIGTFSGGSGRTPLVINFHATATPAAAQALTRNLTYRNVSTTPSTAQRVVRLSLNDGDGATRLVSKQVNVIATP